MDRTLNSRWYGAAVLLAALMVVSGLVVSSQAGPKHGVVASTGQEGGPPNCNQNAGPCCVAHPSPGCDDPKCCNIVCSIRPECCDFQWDDPCAQLAQLKCPACQGDGVCGPGNGGDCFLFNDSPGCDDANCCQIVCGIDPFCCQIVWDTGCAQLALDNCPIPPCPWDCVGNDRIIGIDEFLAVLGSWGEVGVPCDFDGGGVGISEFLKILGTWGPCDQPQCTGENITGPWRIFNDTTRSQSFV